MTGKGSGRVLLAGLVCCRPGRTPRLLYRTLVYRSRTGGGKKGFRAREFAALLAVAHRCLGAPIILVWDNASTHHALRFREFCERNADWLTVYRLPPYAPELNPVEGVWAHLRRSLANLAPHGLDDLARLVRSRLRNLQADPDALDGFLAETGLTLDLAGSSP